LNYFTRILFVWVLVPFFIKQSALAQTLPEIVALASNPTWIKLGHYETDNKSRSGWRSALHPGEFFLHPEGHTDPLVELKATVAALNAAPEDNHDQHAQCRFPARLIWLKEKLQNHLTFRNDVVCHAFHEWTQSNDITSVSVVFASGSLGNPATYYGHTLLKFNFKSAQTNTRLMDESVNYGAILEGTNDNQFVYIFKGLTGGYDAGFSHINFYYHDHNYGDRELRDLWEYKLNLTQKAVDLIAAHSWEVLGKRYTYYFFKGNCAYQMGKVLEVVDGLQVIPEDRPWTIPQALIQRLSTTYTNNQPLVSEIKFHPSRKSRFYEKYKNLSQEEVKIFETVALDVSATKDEAFQQCSIQCQQAVLDTLLDYKQYVNNPIATAPLDIKREYAEALSLRYKLPPGKPDVDKHIPKSPDLGRPPGWIQIGIGNNSILGNSLSLQIRPAYYDALDADSGHINNGALVMGDLRAEIYEDRIRIDWFDLIHLENVNPAISNLPGDRGLAWRLRIGAEQARLWCKDCLVARLQGDIGYGRQLFSRLFAATYLGGAIQNESADQGLGFARTSAVLIAEPWSSFRMQLGYEYRYPISSDTLNYGVASLTTRWLLSQNKDLRIQFDYDEEKQLSVGIGVYW
jgi:hypothetical protein